MGKFDIKENGIPVHSMKKVSRTVTKMELGATLCTWIGVEEKYVVKPFGIDSQGMEETLKGGLYI